MRPLTRAAAFAAFAALSLSCCIAWAQNHRWTNENQWMEIGESNGVVVSWRFRHELRDQVITELKFQNTNPFKVEISYRSHFQCADGRSVTDSGQADSLRAGESKGGQWAGMFWYPCQGEQPPVRAGYRDLRVKRAT